MSKKTILQFLKDLFFFTKSKLIVFVILTALLTLQQIGQAQLLGGAWSDTFILIGFLYIIISIIWFIFKSRNHFIVGLIILFVFVFSLKISNTYFYQERLKAEAECMNEREYQKEIGVMNCMISKGYKFYR